MCAGSSSKEEPLKRGFEQKIVVRDVFREVGLEDWGTVKIMFIILWQ